MGIQKRFFLRLLRVYQCQNYTLAHERVTSLVIFESWEMTRYRRMEHTLTLCTRIQTLKARQVPCDFSSHILACSQRSQCIYDTMARTEIRQSIQTRNRCTGSCICHLEPWLVLHHSGGPNIDTDLWLEERARSRVNFTGIFVGKICFLFNPTIAILLLLLLRLLVMYPKSSSFLSLFPLLSNRDSFSVNSPKLCELATYA